MEEKNKPGTDGWIDCLYGFYRTQTSCSPPGCEEIEKRISEQEERLEQYVSQPGWDVYQVIGDLIGERHLIENQEAFQMGFSFGVKLLMEGRSHPSYEKMLSYALKHPPNMG